MRPKFFALCAAGFLLASVSHCASAQNGASSAPLISSGRPANPSSSGARRTLSDDEPSGALPDASGVLRDEAVSPRDQPPHNPAGLRDESWTAAALEPASSATQSSRSPKHLSDSGRNDADAPSQPSVIPTAVPYQALPHQPVSQHSVSRDSASQHSAPLQMVPPENALPQGAPAVVQTAGGVYPPSGASHLRSRVSQAQYTSAAASSPEPRRDVNSIETSGDQHRPLKPPTAIDPASQEKRSTGTVQMFISVVSSLLIVVGLLLGAAWCYRKATPSLTGSLPKQALQVLGRTPLAPRQQLILVRFGHKLVLMSNLQGEVRTISEIADPLEVDRICGMCESSQAGSISDSFRTVLHNIGRTG